MPKKLWTYHKSPYSVFYYCAGSVFLLFCVLCYWLQVCVNARAVLYGRWGIWKLLCKPAVWEKRDGSWGFFFFFGKPGPKYSCAFSPSPLEKESWRLEKKGILILEGQQHTCDLTSLAATNIAIICCELTTLKEHPHSRLSTAADCTHTTNFRNLSEEPEANICEQAGWHFWAFSSCKIVHLTWTYTSEPMIRSCDPSAWWGLD